MYGKSTKFVVREMTGILSLDTMYVIFNDVINFMSLYFICIMEIICFTHFL